MTDYEMLMIVLTILSLLIAVDLKSRKQNANRRAVAAAGGSVFPNSG